MPQTSFWYYSMNAVTEFFELSSVWTEGIFCIYQWVVMLLLQYQTSFYLPFLPCVIKSTQTERRQISRFKTWETCRHADLWHTFMQCITVCNKMKCSSQYKCNAQCSNCNSNTSLITMQCMQGFAYITSTSQFRQFIMSSTALTKFMCFI